MSGDAKDERGAARAEIVGVPTCSPGDRAARARTRAPLTLRVREVDPPPDHQARFERATSILVKLVARSILEKRRPAGDSSADEPPPNAP